MGPVTTVNGEPVRGLARLVASRASGILRAIRGKHRRLICLGRGKLLFVASNVIEEQVEEYLIRDGLLDPASQARLQIEARKARKKLTALLAEGKLVPPERLRELIVRRNLDLVRSTLEWSDGEFAFEEGRPDLEGEIVAEASCLPVVLEHTRRHPESIDEVVAGIGPPDTRPIVADDGASLVDETDLDDTARKVMQRSDGSRLVGEVAARVPGNEEGALRAIYGLMLLGVLRPAGAGEIRGTERGKADLVTRDEVQARVARAETDHYTVLGVTPDATSEQIREAYYFLARRYHPDRFRSGELTDLLRDIERYFTKVTEAYNTLSSAEMRERYDEEQADRLAGVSAEPEQDTGYLARQNYVRGKMAAEKKQFREAVRFLENAIDLDPGNAEYRMELGRLLILNPRRRGDAEDLLKRATELDPSLLASYLALGELYEKTGRGEDAVRMYREALQWEPDLDEALDRLEALGEKP